MKLLVKLGGTLLDSAESRAAISGQIAAAAKLVPQTVVVHGGGKQMTRYMTEANRARHSHLVCIHVVDISLAITSNAGNHRKKSIGGKNVQHLGVSLSHLAYRTQFGIQLHRFRQARINAAEPHRIRTLPHQ